MMMALRMSHEQMSHEARERETRERERRVDESRDERKKRINMYLKEQTRSQIENCLSLAGLLAH